MGFNIIVLEYDNILLVDLEYKEDIFTICLFKSLNGLVVYYHILI